MIRWFSLFLKRIPIYRVSHRLLYPLGLRHEKSLIQYWAQRIWGFIGNLGWKRYFTIQKSMENILFNKNMKCFHEIISFSWYHNMSGRKWKVRNAFRWNRFNSLAGISLEYATSEGFIFLQSRSLSRPWDFNWSYIFEPGIGWNIDFFTRRISQNTIPLVRETVAYIAYGACKMNLNS